MDLDLGEKPDINFAEVTILGTGGGYGESIVIHVGNNEWVIVDSCVAPKSKENLPLKYLSSLGIEVSEKVKLVICTHWHDDHIRGMSEIIMNCPAAKFCMANQLDMEKFLLFAQVESAKGKFSSSTSEFNKCIELIKTRKNNIIITASQDRKIFKNDSSSIYSLSPSDEIIKNFNIEISTRLNPTILNRKYIIDTPNEKSIVLLIQFTKHSILLGSDMEISDSPDKGWLCILDKSTIINSQPNPSFFKIPHHGSKNGYEPRIWKEVLEKNPLSAITPWNKNRKLPSEEMIDKYKEHTDRIYSTASATSNKPKDRERSIAKAIKEFNPTLREVGYNLGIIRNRINYEKSDAEWHTDLFGTAFKIT